MARPEDRLPENVPGDFYVDSSCIDCETCMIVAPAVFAESDRELAFVHRQPGNGDDLLRARMALVSCPTSSIGDLGKGSATRASRAFPEPVEPGSEVHYCGYAHEGSFGASSYLILRPRGNVLVDSPRAAAPLLRRIEALGGVRWMFLTHRDDVADHEIFHRRFGCDRILHEKDREPGTMGVEKPVSGTDPVSLDDDLTIVPLPGHTRGSAALLYGGEFLFTGDHLWGREDGRLGASRGVAWFSWAEQIRSMEKLLELPFRWVLPGHGRRWRASSEQHRRESLEGLISRMKGR